MQNPSIINFKDIPLYTYVRDYIAEMREFYGMMASNAEIASRADESWNVTDKGTQKTLEKNLSQHHLVYLKYKLN